MRKLKSKIKKIIKRIINIGIKPVLFCYSNIKKQKNVKIIIKEKKNIFFGYYNKCPWNASEKHILSIEVKTACGEPDNISEANIVFLDANTGNKEVLDTTRCWNTQQGCMLQWLGPKYEELIIYNDFENNNFVSKILNVKTKKIIKTLEKPIYDISSDGKYALTLDFTRLHEMRPGYGYRNLKCKNANLKCPNDTCIWKIDIETGKVSSILKYTDLYNFETKDSMVDAVHKVNHIVINPSNNRFMFLHRWYKDGKKYSRLITCNIDGKQLFNLSDDDMVSHCCWKNDSEILGFLRKKEYGDHYYLLRDFTNEYKIIWDKITVDGHCTYDRNRDLIVSDTYPNLFGISKVYIGKENDSKPMVVAKFFSPSIYSDDLRCDLHPRWNYKGNKICVDSVNDGYKKIYEIKVEKGE